MPPEETGLDLTAETTPAAPAVPDGFILVEVGDLDATSFKSEQALVDSYREAQRKITEQGRGRNDEREAREAAEARVQELEAALTAQQPPAQQQVPYDQNPLVAYAQDKLLEGDIGPFLNLAADIGRTAAIEAVGQQPKAEEVPTDLDALAFTAEQQVWQRHGDAYGELRPEVAQILQDNPDLVKGTTFKDFEGGIDMAFRLAQRDQLLQNQQQQAQQAAEQETSRKAKLQAQTATGAGTRPPTPDEQKQVWDEIKNATSGGWKGAQPA